MQPHRPTTESTFLPEHSAMRGLEGMNAKHAGANFWDGGSISSLNVHPQLTPDLFYNKQSQGQNRVAEVSAKTVEAARNADLDILSASQNAEKANEYARMAKVYEMQKPGFDSSNVRKLADPEVAKQTFQDVNVINQQSRQSRMFA